MVEQITLIVCESLHLPIIKDLDYRKFENNNTDICTRILKEIILAMVEIMKLKIGRQIKKWAAGQSYIIVRPKILHTILNCTAVIFAS